jgi:flagellar basal body-associated protein FliL
MSSFVWIIVLVLILTFVGAATLAFILLGRPRNAAADRRGKKAADQSGTAVASQTDRTGETKPDPHPQTQFLGQRQSLQR